LTVGTQEI
jgi:hypothetical protein